MSMLRKFVPGLKALFRKEKSDHELDEELQGFIEASAEQKMRAGMDREQALRAARMEMGSTAALKDEVHRSGWESVVEGIWQDVRYGVRTLRNAPGFTTIAVMTLALGIGVNAGIFTILNAAALRPLPLARSRELVSIYQNLQGHYRRNIHGSSALSSYSEYQDFCDHNHVFTGLLAYAPFLPATLTSGKPKALMGTLASCNYFEVLEVRPALGRTFTASDCASSGSEPVAVLSNDLWRSDFGSDPAIIGKIVHLNRVPVTVVGIAPAGFTGTEAVSSDFWSPLTTQSSLMHEADFSADRFMAWLALIGRVKAGVSRAQVQADLSVITAKFDLLQPGRKTTLVLATPTSSSDPEAHTMVMSVGAVILFAVGLVLLIACANIANLLLARAAGRSKEIAVRLAIGARRSRIIRQLLTESLLLALIGGFFGTLTAFWVAPSVVHFLLSHLPPGSPVLTLDAHPDFRVLLYALVLTIITGIAFGLIPAFRSSRADLTLAMKQEATSENRRKAGFLRHALVGVQVAVCMVLLAAAALLLRGLERAQNVDPGFVMKDIYLTSFDLRAAGYDNKSAADFQSKLRDHLAAVPGFDMVAQSEVTPLDDDHDVTDFRVPEAGQEFDLEYNNVSPDYFPLLAIPIVRGRTFTDAECRSNALVAIVTESTARRFWPGKDPLGKVLQTVEKNPKDLEVVGVAKDAEVSHLGVSNDNYVYLPAAPGAQMRFSLLVHSQSGAAPAGKAIQAATSQLDPELPVSVSKLEDNLEFWRTPSRILSVLSGILSTLALILASLGIYGMASYSVSRRVREIGIRMALGADAGNVMFLVLRQSMWPVLFGAIAGLGGIAAVSGILTSMLYGISPHDPIAFFSVAAVFLVVAFLASYVPTRRAMQVDPMVALRHE
jgi:macrolide transport system ATP-binding/permease protein